MVPDLLTDPDSFYRRELERDGFAKPIAVVSVLGLVTALGQLPIVHATVQALPEDVGAFAAIAYVTTLVGGFVGAFVVWAIYAAAFYLVSRFVFGGDGPFVRTLRATAWGFVPAIVVAVVSGILGLYAIQGVTFPSDPARVWAFAAELQRRPLFLASGVLGVFFLLWQAFIWIFGVRHAQGIDLRDAAITVAIPVGIAILWRVYNLV